MPTCWWGAGVSARTNIGRLRRRRRKRPREKQTVGRCFPRRLRSRSGGGLGTVSRGPRGVVLLPLASYKTKIRAFRPLKLFRIGRESSGGLGRPVGLAAGERAGIAFDLRRSVEDCLKRPSYGVRAHSGLSTCPNRKSTTTWALSKALDCRHEWLEHTTTRHSPAEGAVMSTAPHHC